MKTLQELLREADPLGSEPGPSVQQRRLVRQAILDTRSVAEESKQRLPAMAAIVALMLVGMAVASHYWFRAASDVVAAVRFEVRLAEESPATGLQEVIIPGTNRKIYLHEESVVTNSDIAEARVIEENAGTKYSVDVEFNADGAAKMSRATRGHIGRPVAILIDGEVVMAPTVRSAISTSANINGDFTKVEVDRIVAGIVGR